MSKNLSQESRFLAILPWRFYTNKVVSSWVQPYFILVLSFENVQHFQVNSMDDYLICSLHFDEEDI